MIRRMDRRRMGGGTEAVCGVAGDVEGCGGKK